MSFYPLTAPVRWTGLLAAAIWLIAGGTGVGVADDADRSIINCNIQNGSCTQELEGSRITLDIEPRPVKAMEDLTFTVSIDPEPAPPQAPLIRLNMPAMDMGKNQVPMKMHAAGVYVGKGVIIRCRSGRRTWKATVVVPQIGTVDYIFDVIY